MYKAFYGLREKPFNLTPDPRFLYLSEKHKEAFAHLLYGIRNRAGFVMVTGEIGTGKTTICRNLLNQLDEDTELAFIFNPMLSPLELLKKIVSEFGIEARGTNALELTEELNEYLLEAAAKGKNCVLLIDEAQNLDPQVLEQIRLLSNLETETEKLLQIVLIGQPELGEKLALHELRQLNQRITARYHLKPLSDKEVLHYVAYRLHVAGGRRQVKFARRAIRAVYKISKGTPRVINALCDRALLIGFTREVRVITPGIVHRAHREIRGDAIFGKKKPRWTLRQLLLNPVAAIALLCVGAAIYLNSPALQARGNALATRIVAALPKATEAPPKATPENAVADPGAVPAPTAATSTTVPTDAPAPQTSTAAALPVPPAPLTQTFESTLAAVPKSASDAAALALMCQAWGKAVPEKLPELSSEGALEAFVQAQSWSHDRLNPALDQLLALDLPAFVKVIAGDSSRWVTLSKAEGDNLTVSISASAPATVNRSEFQRRRGPGALAGQPSRCRRAPSRTAGTRRVPAERETSAPEPPAPGEYDEHL
jgi:general secretion pathway protein A